MNDFYERLNELYAANVFQDVEDFLKNSAGDASSVSVRIMALNELGTLYRVTGQGERAEESYLEAAAMEEQRSGMSFELGTILMNLASAYRLNGEYEQSMRTFERVKDIYRQTVGPDSYYYAAVLNNIGLLYLDWEDGIHAGEHFKQALVILADNPAYDTERAATISNLASTEFAAGNYSGGKLLARQSIELFLTLDENKRDHLAEAYNVLGNSCAALQEWEDAEAAFCEVVRLTENNFGKQKEYTTARRMLAETREKRGEYERA